MLPVVNKSPGGRRLGGHRVETSADVGKLANYELGAVLVNDVVVEVLNVDGRYIRGRAVLGVVRPLVAVNSAVKLAAVALEYTQSPVWIGFHPKPAHALFGFLSPTSNGHGPE